MFINQSQNTEVSKQNKTCCQLFVSWINDDDSISDLIFDFIVHFSLFFIQ